MKYYPKLGQPIHAEPYDGTTESVERINAMLKEFSPECSIKSFDSSTIDIELENGKILFCGIGRHIIVHPTTEEVCVFERLSSDYSASPAPIRPLEWVKNDAFYWAQGVNCHYEWWLSDCLFWIRSSNPSEPISIPFEDAEQVAQAHHAAQVLSFLNL